ncbi:hypothetical protein PCASD_17899 [Puccinia coronata f. sp. avenae]|uniref:Secreted protein n=1 Tax=Puccinia coronata f. sp. avenae TaxID=200324 RepID=A0A2N5U940_9BASI|nr:hypothetical protein PCASD_17899 [Puccinia coronata f. sp. avenae]
MHVPIGILILGAQLVRLSASMGGGSDPVFHSGTCIRTDRPLERCINIPGDCKDLDCKATVANRYWQYKCPDCDGLSRLHPDQPLCPSHAPQKD